MSRPVSLAILFLFTLHSICASQPSSPELSATGVGPFSTLPVGAAESQRVIRDYATIPLSFEPSSDNLNQTYFCHGAAYALSIGSHGATVSVRSSSTGKRSVIGLRFAGAKELQAARPGDPLPGRINYLKGDDVSKWRTDIPTYAKVRYQSVYPGIDLVYYGNQRRLEYDFLVAPGADPSDISLSLTSHNGPGAECVRLVDNGDLVLATQGGEFRQHRPFIYQVIDGVQKQIEGSYRLAADGTIGISVGPYDRSRELVIDPILSFSSFLGSDNIAGAIAIDKSGNAIISGTTTSVSNPQTGLPFTGGYEAFVAGLSADGKTLQFFSFLGGSGDEVASGLALDASNNLYVTGTTNSTDFPTTPEAVMGSNSRAAFVRTSNSGATWTASDRGFVPAPIYSLANSRANVSEIYAGTDGGITKSTDAGQTWSANLPGVPNDQIVSLLVDPNNSAFVYAASLDSGLIKSRNGGLLWTPIDAPNFGPKPPDRLVIDPNDPATIYAYRYNGSSVYKSTDRAVSFTAVDDDLPATSTRSPLAIGKNSALFVAQDDGSIYTSTNGGTSWDKIGSAGAGIYSIAVDPDDPFNLYVAGTFGVKQSTDGGATWRTRNTGLGGNGMTEVMIDPRKTTTLYTWSRISDLGLYKSTNSGTAWIKMGEMPMLTEPSALQIIATDPEVLLIGSSVSRDNFNEAFVTKLDPAGGTILYSSYFGGTTSDFGVAVAVDSDRNIIMTGRATSYDVPTRNAYQASRPAGAPNTMSAFVSKINPALSGQAGLIYSTYFGADPLVIVNAMALDGTGKIFIAGETTSSSLPVTTDAYQKTRSNAAGGNPDAFVAKFDPALTGSASLLYSSYLGSEESDAAYGIAVDPTGSRVLLAGLTASTGFPTTATAVQRSIAGMMDGFAAVLNPAAAGAAALEYSTYLGGSGGDNAQSILADAKGNIYVAGSTSSANFPVTPDADQATYAGGYDAFLVRIDPTSGTLRYGTFFGGNGGEGSTMRIAADASGNIFLLSDSRSLNLKTTPGVFQPAIDGEGSVFIAKFLAPVSGITESRNDLFGLKSFPDPATTASSISFVLPHPDHVRLEIFDSFGRSISVLADDRFDAGEHRARFDVTSLPSGVYRYRLTAGGSVAEKDLVVVR